MIRAWRVSRGPRLLLPSACREENEHNIGGETTDGPAGGNCDAGNDGHCDAGNGRHCDGLEGARAGMLAGSDGEEGNSCHRGCDDDPEWGGNGNGTGSASESMTLIGDGRAAMADRAGMANDGGLWE